MIKSFIIIGPQGSGKGTQARLLADFLGYGNFSMGEICREARNRTDKLGQMARAYYDQGKLYPESLTLSLAEDYLAKMEKNIGVIFEGYPRTIEQIPDFNHLIKKFGFEEPWVIYLDISKATITKRISARLVCSKCSTPYLPGDHNYLSNVCALCQAKLIVRPDDKPLAIKNRMQVYFHETVPVINHYQQLQKLIKINGEPPINEVHQEIINKLKAQKLI